MHDLSSINLIAGEEGPIWKLLSYAIPIYEVTFYFTSTLFWFEFQGAITLTALVNDPILEMLFYGNPITHYTMGG